MQPAARVSIFFVVRLGLIRRDAADYLLHRATTLPETSFADSDFADWPLHDAIVGPITLDLEAGSCRLDLDVFLRYGEDARPAQIKWEGVSAFTATQESPWGRSFPAVNRQWREGHHYVLELQTGDHIRILAQSAALSERRTV